MRNFIVFLIVVVVAVGAYAYFVDPTLFGLVEQDTAAQIGGAADEAANAVGEAAEEAADAAGEAADNAGDAVEDATGSTSQ